LGAIGRGQRPIVMPHYPHMMAADAAIWTEYLRDPVVPVLEVWYDVHVGRAVEVGAGAGDMERRIAAGLTRKRIDCVCRVAAGYWVVEVKPRGDMQALGQVLSYTRLFRQEYRAGGEASPVVVCGEVDEDLVEEYEARGVAVIAV